MPSCPVPSLTSLATVEGRSVLPEGWRADPQRPELQPALLELIRRTTSRLPQDVIEALVAGRNAEAEASRGADGRIYALPVFADAFGLAYNTDALAKAGFDIQWVEIPSARQLVMVRDAREPMAALGWYRNAERERFAAGLATQLEERDASLKLSQAELTLLETRIDHAVADGSLARNPALLDAIAALKKSGGVLHLIGLLSPGGVHSSQAHILALARTVAQAGVPVRVHALLDGRDTPPSSGLGYMKTFLAGIQGLDIAVTTVAGRFYGMDRDKRWDRVQCAYDAIVSAKGAPAKDALAAIEASYADGKTDEFMLPAIIGDYAGVRDGDGVAMANFRADRAREILTALLDPAFDGFTRGHVASFAVRLGMTEYSDALNPFLNTLFPAESLTGILGEIVSASGRTQLRIAETERQGHRARFEFESMQARQQRRPSRRQLRRQARERLRRMPRQQRRQVLAAEGMRLQRDHMQSARALRIVAPGAPQRQEIQAQAETGLAYGERPASPPALRQPVATQEHLLGLPQRARGRVIDVAICRAVKPALRVESDNGGGQGHIGRRHGNRLRKYRERRKKRIIG